MKPTRTDLWLLLQLMEGTIPSAEREALRARIAVDRVLRQRWQQLNSVQETGADLVALTATVSADDIAAFIDGTLTQTEELAFEERCWQSPEILFELISLTTNSAQEEPISDVLSQRLLSLNAAAEETERDILPTIEIKTVTSSSEKKPTRYLVPALLTVIAGLLAAVLWLAMRDDGRNKIAEDKTPQLPVEKRDRMDLPEEKLVDQNQTPDTPERTEVPESPTPDDITPPGTTDSPKIVDVPPTMPTPQEPDIPKMPEPDTTVPKPNPTRAVATSWSTVGVVGVRAATTDNWRGLNAIELPVDSYFLTLPTSRAMTKSAEGIEFVVGPQSEVSSLTWGERSEVTIHRGMAAFRKLQKNDVVRFLIGNQKWTATAKENDTTLVVAVQGLGSRLAILAGKARVEQKLVAANHWLAPGSSAQPLPNLDSFAWLDQKMTSNFAGPRLARLMNSQDLRASVMREASGRGALMMLAPEANVYQMLNSAIPEQRHAALWWLVSNPDLGKGTPGNLAWQNIRTALTRFNDPNDRPLADYMEAWLKDIRLNRVSGKSQLLKMATYLEKNPRAVRYVGFACLIHNFGPKFPFDVEDDITRRRRVANAWRKEIQRSP